MVTRGWLCCSHSDIFKGSLRKAALLPPICGWQTCLLHQLHTGGPMVRGEQGLHAWAWVGAICFCLYCNNMSFFSLVAFIYCSISMPKLSMPRLNKGAKRATSTTHIQRTHPLHAVLQHIGQCCRHKRGAAIFTQCSHFITGLSLDHLVGNCYPQVSHSTWMEVQ